ncbi:UvrD-helicase domain-containing protein [Tamlana sp. 2_MG-2023]|uniref:UvrD-helicase domain-containing protein n=1 Tax=unclassified Tamlana TaxID=2614803 RepID=UPI0026E2D0F6|nr:MULTISPECIES: UvrD-helicase domain-containing protein [unclassified Tamlana]MDO6761124.1 UvrD-helicase domain-containing protein [Tamlana sp. 2_MG-2023]MDO6791543.1 UvrD-helicase domain-containing protein [Tamlana sp. 1_MG-2023]
MQPTAPFTIYNASAGSGKTYTLVKEYLKILFEAPYKDQFKRILAITFTNKAVAEMKERIIETLKRFANPEVLTSNDSMFLSICEELKIEPEDLHKKSEALLNNIIHNYAAFDISTIDGFTHKLIRTFAHDLKLPLNFEVELDQDALLYEAVDSLITKAGTDAELTKILVDFALEKADDDKSWDVSFDFNKIAKLLTNENDIPFIEKLKDKSLEDFKLLKTQLKKEISTSENKISNLAQQVLDLIENSGLETSNFTRSTLPNHFKKAKALNFDRLYDNKLEENITERKGIYTKTLDDKLKDLIDSILPELELKYKAIKAKVFHLKFLKAFYRNITPLSVLNAINTELTELKEAQNKMLISEFNAIISTEIKEQPTPFIYERIGEKFKHYFIDEFQDTSVMQWENLIPLLGNSLSTLGGTTMLVGDAKQAIYRWRGGKAEQFIGIFNNENPFHIDKQVENLPSNFRSFKEVVTFNNGLFQFLSHHVFNHADYQSLYKNAAQNVTQEKEGYVELSFLEIEKEDVRDELFPEVTLEKIKNCLENGFKLKEICVLVRKKKEGVAVANYLSQHNIPIISSETLLINNAPEVGFINNLLALLIQPKNNEIKIKVLNFLTDHFQIENKHAFFINHINLPISDLFKSFETFNIYISNTSLLQLPLYDLAETLVRTFNLVKNSNAYVQFFLDIIHDFSQKKGSDISGFLEYFDKKKESLSIISPKGQDAVQIMTIHKSKGLEFPVVIFPYADLDIYREIEPKEWFKIDEEKYNGLSHTLLNYNKDFEHFGDEGLNIFNRHQSEQELDNINLLYVALTRAVEQLYVISTKDISTKGEVNSKKYSGLLINYLQHLGMWQDSELIYPFGNQQKTSEAASEIRDTEFQQEFISTAKEDHNIKVVTKSGFLWDTNQQEAIEKGNLIHDIMALISTEQDVDAVISDYLKSAIINPEQARFLKDTVFRIVSHPDLKQYYSEIHTIYNERDIITKEGLVYRPDRVVINDKNEAVIIDYKTGAEDKKHAQQLQLYQDVLEDMKITVKKKILIYTDYDITVKVV